MLDFILNFSSALSYTSRTNRKALRGFRELDEDIKVRVEQRAQRAINLNPVDALPAPQLIPQDSSRKFTLISKSGRSRTLIVPINDPMGNGATKNCFSATFTVGKTPYRVKKKVLLEGVPDVNREAFLEDIHNCVNISKVLREEAAKIGREDLFMKYTEVQENGAAIGLMAEKASGGTLFDYLKDQNPDKPKLEIYLVIEDILLAGSIMERAGVYHRDLKSENVFIESRRPIIGDFGFSTVDPNLNDLKGTRTYFPPNLIVKIARKEVIPILRDQKVDSFAIGMIILELLTGRTCANSFEHRIILNNVPCDLLNQHTIHEHIENMNECSDSMKLLMRNLLQYSPKDRLSLSEAYEYFLRNVKT